MRIGLKIQSGAKAQTGGAKQRTGGAAGAKYSVPVSEPLLYSKRIGFINDNPFECSITKIIADRYEYSVYLEREFHKV
jgi:hypothetical protein